MDPIYAQYKNNTYFFSGITSKVTIEELERRGYRISEANDYDGEFVVIMVKR